MQQMRQCSPTYANDEGFADYVETLVSFISSKAMFIAGFCQAGMARFKGWNDVGNAYVNITPWSGKWMSFSYLVAASCSVFSAAACTFITTEILCCFNDLHRGPRRHFFAVQVYFIAKLMV